jgi:prophage antirepressor-like protein
MNEHHYSALDQHALLTLSDDGFPWFAGSMLALESCEVVRLRLEKFAKHDDDAEREACLMVSEKIAAALEAGVNWFCGATPASIIGRYREQVAANAKRLSAA